ncbi:MAG: caspase family protein [Bacteroidota bacterium]
MKKAVLLLTLAACTLPVLSQVSESKSGVQQFSISKKNSDARKTEDESRGPADRIPPKISLESPVLSQDSLVRCSTKTLIVIGKVADDGGIFDVSVNGIEAKVSADGIFMAEIPLAFGKNQVNVTARDVSLNRSRISFSSERTADVLPEAQAVVPEKTQPVYSIDMLSATGDHISVASGKYELKACVKASGPIKKLIIYRNNSFVNGYTSGKIIPDGDCAFRIDEEVELKLGENDLRIEVITDNGDTISKSLSVEYSFYAARNYAIIIGNNEYDDPAIPDLAEPAKDAKELYKTLTQQYNFDPEDVTLLTDATKADIIGALHRMRFQVKPDDNLLIFYAGHGYWDEGMGVGYWLPRDAGSNNPVDWIPNTDLTNYLSAIKTKHTLLIADACFSGGIFKSRSAFNESYAIEMLYQLNSRKAITSGTLTEVPDKSAFFQYLNKNLRENTAEYLPAEDLFSKMRIAVINNSDNVPQYGTIQNVGDEGGDFIFIRRK